MQAKDSHLKLTKYIDITGVFRTQLDIYHGNLWQK